MKNLLRFFSLIVIVASLSSCSSARLTSSWTKDGYTAQAYKKIMVLAISKNTSGRASVESAMVNELRKQGFSAVSTLDVFPNYNPDMKLEKEIIAQKLRDNNVDALVVLSMLDKKSEQVYVQGQTYTQAVSPSYHPSGYYNQYYPSYSNYYGYYSTVYETVHEPGYYQEQTTYYLESNFYQVSNEALVWSGQCEAIDPSSIAKGAKDWAVEVVSGLQYDKVLVAPSKK